MNVTNTTQLLWNIWSQFSFTNIEKKDFSMFILLSFSPTQTETQSPESCVNHPLVVSSDNVTKKSKQTYTTTRWRKHNCGGLCYVAFFSRHYSHSFHICCCCTEPQHQTGALSLRCSRNLMMASSKHHLVVLLSPVWRIKKINPSSTPALPPAHKHTQVICTHVTCTCAHMSNVHDFMHTHTHSWYKDAHFPLWLSAGVCCHYSSLRPPISQCSVITLVIY